MSLESIAAIAALRDSHLAAASMCTAQLRDEVRATKASISELAAAANVTRPTIYGWLPSMKQQPISQVAETYNLSERQLKRAVADFAAAHSGTTPYVYNTVEDVTPAFVKFVANRITKTQRGPRN